MNICIFAQIKDEQLYLDEWIKYHLNMGFMHIYLMEDFGSSSHQEIVDRYKSKVTLWRLCDIVKEEELHTVSQRWSFQWFTDNFMGDRSDVDWCLFNDVDEFFELEQGVTMESFLSGFEDCTAIVLRWKTYGANGVVYRNPDKTCEELYKNESNIVLYSVSAYDHKSFVNFNKDKAYTWITVHDYPCGVTTTHQFFGEYRYMTKSNGCYDKAWINHYFTKSWEDWLIRLKRGNVFRGRRSIDEFFTYNQGMLDKKDELVREFGLEDVNPSVGPQEFVLDIPKNYTPSRYDIKLLGYPELKGIFNSVNEYNNANYDRIRTNKMTRMEWYMNSFKDISEGVTHRVLIYNNTKFMPAFETEIDKLINEFSDYIIYLNPHRGLKYKPYEIGCVQHIFGFPMRFNEYCGVIIPVKYISMIQECMEFFNMNTFIDVMNYHHFLNRKVVFSDWIYAATKMCNLISYVLNPGAMFFETTPTNFVESSIDTIGMESSAQNVVYNLRIDGRISSQVQYENIRNKHL